MEHTFFLKLADQDDDAVALENDFDNFIDKFTDVVAKKFPEGFPTREFLNWYSTLSFVNIGDDDDFELIVKDCYPLFVCRCNSSLLCDEDILKMFPKCHFIYREDNKRRYSKTKYLCINDKDFLTGEVKKFLQTDVSNDIKFNTLVSYIQALYGENLRRVISDGNTVKFRLTSSYVDSVMSAIDDVGMTDSVTVERTEGFISISI
uniref:Uncharacterized protein n=1 Tax=viral metagenome TaxID=1070528 RepID=A0A6C0EB48_9ZZZZ